jgi:hypothetical protein
LPGIIGSLLWIGLTGLSAFMAILVNGET